ncbi:MAG TPA: hypothetical protein VGT44_18355, partial [Ktedonobacteraceae bacterium]|nr:hypothetical protein [Ktedonobacteraceae bacterium]
MSASQWFDGIPVIGKLPPEQAVEKLREVGEDEIADMLEVQQGSAAKSFEIAKRGWWPFPAREKPWLHT